MRRGIIKDFVQKATIWGNWFRLANRYRPILEQFTLPITNLPPNAHGITIAHLSDFHADAVPLKLFERMVSMTNALNADLIMLTGDFTDYDPTSIFDLAPFLAQLRAKQGIFACIGNHDLSPFVPEHRHMVEYGLRHWGIELLVNQHRVLPSGLVVAGVDEPYEGSADLELALAGVSADSRAILLCHRPDLADRFSADSRVALQLSGHSHGGQLQLPWLGTPLLPTLGKRYHRGLYRIGRMWLYTSRGLGMSRVLKLRWNCPPEITLIQLVPSEAR